MKFERRFWEEALKLGLPPLLFTALVDFLLLAEAIPRFTLLREANLPLGDPHFHFLDSRSYPF